MKYILIDDDPIINLVHKRIIQKVDETAEIEVFVSGSKALDYLKKKKNSDKEVILLDINMPEMNGFEFLDEVVKDKLIKRDALNIFILTSSLNNKDYEQAKSYPILKGYLGKPLNVNKVLGLVPS